MLKRSAFRKIVFLLLIAWSLIFKAQCINAEKLFEGRIISLAPAITERLYLLGLGDSIIGNTTYCVRPEEAKHIEKVGSLIDADIEKVIALKPDIIFAINLTNPKLIKKLESLGFRVELFKQPNSFSELLKEYERLGKIVGRSEEARKLASAVHKEINNIKEQTKSLEKPKVFVQIGADPIFTATKDSFVNDFIEYAGADNIAYDAGRGIYSREEVLRKNPDVIFIVTMGITGEQQKEKWRTYKTLEAVKNKKIYVLDSYEICSPSPAGLVSSLRSISLLLHPELKNDSKE